MKNEWKVSANTKRKYNEMPWENEGLKETATEARLRQYVQAVYPEHPATGKIGTKLKKNHPMAEDSKQKEKIMLTQQLKQNEKCQAWH